METLTNPFAEEAEVRWPEQYAESQRRVAKLSKAEMAEIMQQHSDAALALAELFKADAKPTDAAVQAQIAKHYQWICNFWTPSREAYINLGKMYVADERFATNYNKYADGLAHFVCEAIEVSGLGD
ncbi:MAG: TipAS antibiotic-recognition domain-containing protein [Micrococcales bacterium]